MDDWKKIEKEKQKDSPTENKFIGGADFDAQLDELAFNRVIRFKNLAEKPQGNTDTAKTYWDTTEQKLKMWVGGTAKWVDILWTSTSTSTTSSSSSSSTSTTSSSSSSSSSTSTS